MEISTADTFSMSFYAHITRSCGIAAAIWNRSKKIRVATALP
jgi:hypothetical protein